MCAPCVILTDISHNMQCSALNIDTSGSEAPKGMAQMKEEKKHTLSLKKPLTSQTYRVELKVCCELIEVWLVITRGS